MASLLSLLGAVHIMDHYRVYIAGLQNISWLHSISHLINYAVLSPSMLSVQSYTHVSA